MSGTEYTCWSPIRDKGIVHVCCVLESVTGFPQRVILVRLHGWRDMLSWEPVMCDPVRHGSLLGMCLTWWLSGCLLRSSLAMLDAVGRAFRVWKLMHACQLGTSKVICQTVQRGRL